MNDIFYTRQELRELLKIKSNALLVRLEKEHKLNPFRMGQIVRYPQSEVMAVFGLGTTATKSEFEEANCF